MVIIIIGIVKTVSRTGLLLLCGTIGMILLLRIEGRNQIRSIFLLIAFLTIVWIFSESLIEIFRSIFPAIRQGTDTIGLRYKLWEAGIRMFKDSMVRGVGIGQYTEKLIFYARDLLPYYRLRLGAHNMYIQALAETGLVGIIIFLSFLGTAMVKFWRGFQSQKPEISSLVKTWLVVFVVLLLGGVTKHDHYDKLLWMTAGISMCSLWNPLKDFDARSKD
jgi:O-antigen ligase